MPELISCSDWLKSHEHTEEYLQILINEGTIAPAQADWIIKSIIIDESGRKYPSDGDPEYPCAFEIWCDFQDIQSYFLTKEREKELEPDSERDNFREEKYQKWKSNLAKMVTDKNIDWKRQKTVFKFSNIPDCKKWLLDKLTNDGLI